MISKFKSFWRFCYDVYLERSILLELAKNDFKAKYANSFLGIIWAFIQPLVIMFVLWFVFQVGFRTEAVTNVPFILWYIPAFLIWNFFSEALQNASGCLFEYSYLVKKMKFRVSILPLVKIISSSFVHLFFIVFIFFMFFIYGYTPNIYNLQVIYYFISTVIFLTGMVWLTSALATFSKDVLNIISVIIQVGFWATPIFWDPGQLSILIQRILKLNPMYYICMGYRDTFINGLWFWEKPIQTIYFWVITILFFIIGAHFFHKMRPHFADVL